jgi:uncharacterized repeat protein (TIGR03803 family)
MNKATLLKIACIHFAFCAATAIAAPAQVLTTLHSFTGYPREGAGPDSALARGSDGNFYGTTGGGGDNCAPVGCGTIFKMTPGGTETTLYSFCAGYPESCTDGHDPYGTLAQAADGDFYGITSSGGTGADNAGTVFKITPSGTLTTLYSFCTQSNCTDGRYPSAMVQGRDGNFYGTTSSGGSSNCTDGCGTIFKITPSGSLTTLYRFCSQSQGNCPDGYNAWGLMQATDGNFYGATGHGGAGNHCSDLGCGTIFKINPSGAFTTLYSFCIQTGCPDGESPNGELLQADDGNFYGTTADGGANDVGDCAEFGCGTVFKITPSGTLTTLYSFCSENNCADGWTPTAGLVQATDGNFYGTTYAGGISAYCNGCGTLFKITPSGTLTTLYNFCSRSGCTDGQQPDAGLLLAPGGNFYGSTIDGGTSNDGTVFRFTVLRECSVCANVE